jgi:hypothetical protein
MNQKIIFYPLGTEYNNMQVDVAGLVNGWNAYLKYSKSDFGKNERGFMLSWLLYSGIMGIGSDFTGNVN